MIDNGSKPSRIIKFFAKNTKVLKAVEIFPEDRDIVLLTGQNCQGKTTVLDDIWMALGGKTCIPGEPIRRGEKEATVTLEFEEFTVTRKITEKGEYLDESGPANFFGISEDGKYITPKSDTILPSITNKSLMTLANDLGMGMERRPVHVNEIFDFTEAGCCGTAAVISPIKSLKYQGKTKIYCQTDEAGPYSQKLYNLLTSIQNGEAEDKHGWNRRVKLD